MGTVMIPDRWVILKLRTKGGEDILKLFSSWFGGYLGTDGWRISTEITSIVDKCDGEYIVECESTTMYTIHKDTTGTTSYTQEVLENMVDSYSDTVEILVDIDLAMLALR